VSQPGHDDLVSIELDVGDLLDREHAPVGDDRGPAALGQLTNAASFS
jgi:hypothetical protein